MIANRKLLAAAAGLICCAVVVWFSTSIRARERTYELRPEISIPEYKTDAARAVDAYERLIQRYMALTERNLLTINSDLKNVVKKLNSVDNKLTQLTARIAGIEKALGIEQPKKPVNKLPKAEKPKHVDRLNSERPK